MITTGTRLLAFVTVTAMLAAPAAADSYFELVPWNTVQAGGTGTSHWAHAVEGQTSYHTVNIGGGAHISKVTNLNGAQASSVLVSNADWMAASGETSMGNATGFGVSGDFLMWTDSNSDALWRADKNSGAITPYVTSAQIIAHTGQASSQSLENYSITPAGEIVWYEGQSDSLLITAGAGVVQTLVTDAQLAALMGNDSVRGGLGYDATGKLYWGNLTTDSMYARAADGTLSTVLGASDITAVTGAGAADFGDIFGAPDGFVYWYERTSDDLMRFDPADPAGTLSIVLTGDELLNGPAASSNVFSLGWYDGKLTFNVIGETGLYAVPEPGTLTMLALVGTFALRRRRI